MITSIPPALADRAEQAGLGRLVSTLTPPRVSSLRTLGIGAVLAAATVAVAATRHPGAWWSVAGLIALGLVGLGFLLVGVIELLPGPGRVYLFAQGMVRVYADGTTETVLASPGGVGQRQTPLRARVGTWPGRTDPELHDIA